MMVLPDGAQHTAGSVLAKDSCGLPAVVPWRKDQALPKSTGYLRQLLPDVSWLERAANFTMLGKVYPFEGNAYQYFPEQALFGV